VLAVALRKAAQRRAVLGGPAVQPLSQMVQDTRIYCAPVPRPAQHGHGLDQTRFGRQRRVMAPQGVEQPIFVSVAWPPRRRIKHAGQRATARFTIDDLPHRLGHRADRP